MELSKQAGDQEAEGRACVAYAECQQQLGQLPGAVASLEAYLELSRSQVGVGFSVQTVAALGSAQHAAIGRGFNPCTSMWKKRRHVQGTASSVEWFLRISYTTQ